MLIATSCLLSSYHVYIYIEIIKRWRGDRDGVRYMYSRCVVGLTKFCWLEIELWQVTVAAENGCMHVTDDWSRVGQQNIYTTIN